MAIQGPGPCSPPDDECMGMPPECCEGNSGAPIRYFSGKIFLEEIDLDAGVPGFSHSRTFLNRNFELNNWDSAQGWNWAVAEWPYIVRRTQVYPTETHESIVLKNGLYALWFDKQSDGTFVCRYGASSRNFLEHQPANGVYVYRQWTSNGMVVMEFQDFMQPEAIAGMMKRKVDTSGFEIQATSYGDKTITTLETLRGGVTFRLRYSYISSGDLEGKISRVEIENEASSEVKSLRAVRYIYYDGSTNEGQLGDLKAAITQQPVASTSPQEWEDVQVKYYRYAAHLLTYVVAPTSYVLLKQSGQDVLFMPNSSTGPDLVPEFADNYYEYDSANRVVKEIARKGEFGTGLQGLNYSRTRNPNIERTREIPDTEEAYNTWIWKIVETGHKDLIKIVYTNSIGQPLAIIQQEISSPERRWFTYNRYDSSGRQILKAASSAIIDISESFPDLVGKRSDGSYTGLRESEGHLILTTFYTETTATSSESGGVKGYPEWSYDQKGFSGTLIPRLLRKYIASDNSSGSAAYAVAEEVRFKTDVDEPTSRVTTTYSYEWYQPTSESPQRIKEKITHYPVVQPAEGGDGVSATKREYFDANGNLIWLMDESGIITHRSYEDARGLLIQEIRDVEEVPTPPGWSVLPGPHFDETHDFQYDHLGRLIVVLGPVHEAVSTGSAESIRRATLTCFVESAIASQGVGQAPVFDQVITAGGYFAVSTSSYTVIDPVHIELNDKAGHAWHKIGSKRTTGTGMLSPADTYVRQDWSRWSSFLHDNRGLLVTERRYHNIPMSATGIEGVSTDIGLEGANFDLTQKGYALDSTLVIRVKTPEGTVNRLVYDSLQRFSSLYIGLNDAPSASPESWREWTPVTPNADLVAVAAYIYDEGLSGGDSNLTRSIAFIDASKSRVTDYIYDFRSRRISEYGEGGHYAEADYDNFDRLIEVRGRNTSALGNLVSKSQTLYNARGQIYETRQYAVDPATGDVGNHLSGKRSYDPAGQLVREIALGGGLKVDRMEYDALRRLVVRKSGYEDGSDFVIVQQEVADFDIASNLVSVAVSKLDVDASVATPTYRVEYKQFWCDPLGRVIANADLGALISAPSRPPTPPASSDLELVAKSAYNERGELYLQIDASDRENRFTFDDKGRQVEAILNYESPGNASDPTADVNRTVRNSYTPDDQLRSIVVAFANQQQTQTTTFVYGTTLNDSAIASNRLLREKTYADGSKETRSYNREGQVVRLEDANGTVHEIIYDGLGRRMHDRVVQFGPDIDTFVQRQTREYEIRGMMQSASACYNADISQPFTINQASFEYDDFGSVTTQYQEHVGKVKSNTKKLIYERADGSQNTNRITRIVYPSGKSFRLDYGPPNGINDSLTRVASVIEESLTGDQTIVAYSYLGLNVAVQIDYPEPEIKLDLWGGVPGAYTGIDRFGRIIDHRWIDSSSQDVVRLQYGYDRNSQRLFRQDDVARAESKDLDELYSYDGLDQITALHRGLLNSAHTALEANTENFRESFGYDSIGNWLNYERAPGVTDQERHFNSVNEIVHITGWAKPRYDATGNMTRIPGGKIPANPFRVNYDAWDRPTRIFSFDPEWNRYRVATHMYDGRGWRVRSLEYIEDGVDRGKFEDIRDYYYDEQWRELEETVNTSSTNQEPGVVQSLFVWDFAANGYRDALLLRLRDVNLDGVFDERTYALQDANFNVVALSGPDGAVLERFNYSAFGVPQYLDGDFTERQHSDYSWEILFSGYKIDRITGLFYVRNRYYNPQLGIWITRDPIAETGGLNLYQYVSNNPLNSRDPLGLCCDKELNQITTNEKLLDETLKRVTLAAKLHANATTALAGALAAAVVGVQGLKAACAAGPIPCAIAAVAYAGLLAIVERARQAVVDAKIELDNAEGNALYYATEIKKWQIRYQQCFARNILHYLYGCPCVN